MHFKAYLVVEVLSVRSVCRGGLKCGWMHGWLWSLTLVNTRGAEFRKFISLQKMFLLHCTRAVKSKRLTQVDSFVDLNVTWVFLTHAHNVLPLLSQNSTGAAFTARHVNNTANPNEMVKPSGWIF